MAARIKHSEAWQRVRERDRRERRLRELCRFLDIRKDNLEKVGAEGTLAKSAGLRTLYEEIDATRGSEIRGHRLRLKDIVREYMKRPGRKLTRKELAAAYKDMVRAHRKRGGR